MLPERLCNYICSLRPNEEKLAYSVIFEMNNDADVLHAQVAKTVICSDRRFTYEEAQTIMNAMDKPLPMIWHCLVNTLLWMVLKKIHKGNGQWRCFSSITSRSNYAPSVSREVPSDLTDPKCALKLTKRDTPSLLM